MLTPLTINVEQHKVFVGKKEVKLAPKEWKLLLAVKAEKGNVITREQLLDRVWGTKDNLDTRTVDQHMCRLRKKVGVGVIETVTCYGYRLSALV